MKNLIRLVMAFSSVALLNACTKQENQVIANGGTNPVLTVSNSANMVLMQSNENNLWNTLTWTNPNYTFNTGISSQDVTYTLQIDTTGANFSNPSKQEINISKDLSTTLTVKAINTLLAKLGVLDGISHNIEMRIKSTLTSATLPLYSNVVKITLTPYLDVIYPVPSELYITGSATPASWQCGCGEPALLSQKFTKVSASKFELNITLNGGASFLFLPVYGSWSAKYGFTGSNNANNVIGDDFKPNGGDMKAPAVTGSYKITVDFKTGKWSVQ